MLQFAHDRNDFVENFRWFRAEFLRQNSHDRNDSVAKEKSRDAFVKNHLGLSFYLFMLYESKLSQLLGKFVRFPANAY